ETPPLEPGVVELLYVTELQSEQVSHPWRHREAAQPGIGQLLLSLVALLVLGAHSTSLPPPETAAARPDPGPDSLGEPGRRSLADPRHVPVGPDQNGFRSGDLPDHGDLPLAGVRRVDQPDPIGPGGYVDGAGLTEVEQRRAGLVEQGVDL